MKRQEYLFEPTQPMQVQTKLGGVQFFPGLNQLQFVAAQVAGAFLFGEVKTKDVATIDYENVALLAVNTAKAVLERCNDEKIVAAQDLEQRTPAIVKPM